MTLMVLDQVQFKLILFWSSAKANSFGPSENCDGFRLSEKPDGF